MGISQLGDDMIKITILGYDNNVLKDILTSYKITYRFIENIGDYEISEWLLVSEKALLSFSDDVFELGSKVIVICKSITQLKLKKFFELGISDYLMEPIIEEELTKRIDFTEEDEFLELDKRLSLAMGIASIGVWDYDIVSGDLTSTAIS